MHGRDPLDRQLDSEVAPGDHDPAQRRLDDASAFSAACGFSILAISGMSAPATRTRRSTPCRSSARRTNETASRSTPCCDGEVDPVEVGATRRGKVHLGPRHVQSLVRGHPSSDLDRAADLAARLPQDPQAHPSVGEVDLVPLVDGRGQPLPRDGQVVRRADPLVGGQGELEPSGAPPHRPRPRRFEAWAPAGRRERQPRGRRPPPPRAPSQCWPHAHRVSRARSRAEDVRPGPISSVSRSTVRVAGPTVATIFVRRCAGVASLGHGLAPRSASTVRGRAQRVAAAGRPRASPAAPRPRARAGPPPAPRAPGCRGVARPPRRAPGRPPRRDQARGTTARPRATPGRRTPEPAPPRAPSA